MVQELLHSFINIFASGRSTTKLYLFFLYLGVLGLLYLALRNRSLYKKSSKRLAWTWFGASILITYIYGLFLHIYYASSSGFGLTDFAITVNNDISSTTLTHTHELKGAIGTFFFMFGKDSFAKSDAGSAYVGELPQPLLIIGALLIMLLLIQAVVYFCVRFLPFITSQTTIRAKLALITLYAITTFALIKTAVDGGIGSSSFWVTAVFLAYVVYRKKLPLASRQVQYLVIVAILSIVLISSLIFSSLALPLGGIAALLALYITLLYIAERKISVRMVAILVIIFIASWIVAGARDLAISQYGFEKIAKGHDYSYYDDVSNQVVSKSATKSTTIREVTSSLGKNLTYSPVAVPGVTCFDKGPFGTIEFDLRTDTALTRSHFKVTPYVKLQQLTKHRQTNDTYSVKLSLNPCTPESLAVIYGYLRDGGVTRAVIINPKLDHTSLE